MFLNISKKANTQKRPKSLQVGILLLFILFEYYPFMSLGQSFKVALLKDIYEVPGAESNATGYFEGEGFVLFTATDGFNGDELWVSQATTESTRLLLDINVGSGGSSPSNFYKIGNRVFFSAFTPEYGRELWVTDGTTEGTHLVKDINPGTSDGLIMSASQIMTSVNDKIFFIGHTVNGSGLWESDGTPTGTIQLFSENQTGNDLLKITEFKNNIFFVALPTNGGANLLGLFKYSLSDEQIVTIKDGDISYYTTLFSNSSYLFFQSAGFSAPAHLYSTDGSPESVISLYSSLPADPRIIISDILYFTTRSNDGQNDELWKTNGIPTETVQVMEGLSFPYLGTDLPSFSRIGNDVLFFASTTGYGRELWKSNGTREGTMLVKDIFPGSSGNVMPPLVSSDSVVFFFADDGSAGVNVVWKSDGTSQGTMAVRNYYVAGQEYRVTNTELSNLTATSVGIFFTPYKYYSNSYGREPYIIGLPKYLDEDHDGFGSNITLALNAPSGYVANGGDCNDSNPDVFPGAPAKADGLDNDCDGVVDKGAQTIMFGPLNNKTVSDDPFYISARSTSGLQIEFSSSDETIVTIQDSLVTILGVGTAYISATQDGNDVYMPAEAVVQILVVEKAPQTLIFATLNDKNIRDTPFYLSAKSTSGLPIAFSSSDGSVISIEDSLVTILTPGTVEIAATQGGNEFYLPADTVIQTLNIEPITEVRNLRETALLIYPNPTSGLIAIGGEISIENYTIKIYDMSGKQVYSKKATGKTRSIDLSNLRPGIYAIQFWDTSSIHFQTRLIKI